MVSTSGRHVVAATAAVLDIAGTMSPPAAFANGLDSYARTHLVDTVVRPGAAVREVVADVVADVRRAVGRSDADVRDVAQVLERWSDEDRKVAPLRTLQGLICQQGFAAGELTGTVFPDVPPALARWRAAGVPLYVYSSCPVRVQRLWFAHCVEADLASAFTAHFDTRNTGAKTQAAAYVRIAEALDSAAEKLVFLSDTCAELDAARTAGWSTIGVRRRGEVHIELGDHPSINSLDGLDLAADRSG
ncbi:acireductone synthase [Solicola gregarius]|uniref:Acireductone synthase n=1 Tax=Solicola gregarius TaxID=2908642 RepID=A0AA46YJ05_9ACTN|nr:acireductone synthase [Solicola gregarius]UYM03657.1 acireductone synthase [Solicola gregarius]